MTALPPWTSVGLAALLAASIALAFLGPRPRHRASPRGIAALLLAGVAAYGVAAGALIADLETLGALVAGGGAEVMSLAAWLSRAPGDDGPGPGWDDDGPDPPDPPPWDWDEFERALRSYGGDRLAQR